MSKHLKSIVLIILAVVAVFIIVERFVQPSEGETRLDYGAFYQKLEAGQVQSFHATGLNAIGDLSNGTKYSVAVPNVDQTFVDEVYKQGQERSDQLRPAVEHRTALQPDDARSARDHRPAALFHPASSAERRKPGALVRTLAREDALREPSEGDVCGRRRRRRSQGRARRDRRLS